MTLSDKYLMETWESEKKTVSGWLLCTANNVPNTHDRTIIDRWIPNNRTLQMNGVFAHSGPFFSLTSLLKELSLSSISSIFIWNSTFRYVRRTHSRSIANDDQQFDENPQSIWNDGFSVRANNARLRNPIIFNILSDFAQ